jgi:hypothetical protein
MESGILHKVSHHLLIRGQGLTKQQPMWILWWMMCHWNKSLAPPPPPSSTHSTYLLTPWSRVLEKLTSKLCSLSKNSPHLWNPKVPHRTHKCPPPVPILSQLHPVPTIPSNFLKIHLNIILPSKSWSPQWPPSLRLPHQRPVHTSILPHTRHMPNSFH